MHLSFHFIVFSFIHLIYARNYLFIVKLSLLVLVLHLCVNKMYRIKFIFIFMFKTF